MINPTSEQSDFYHAVANDRTSILMDAVAGSGKTTTIVQALTKIPHDPTISFLPPSVAFLAFNKSIADTLRSRCPRHVSCTTFHSLGFGALKRAGAVPKDVKIDAAKVRKLVFNAVGGQNPDIPNICKLISLLKSSLNELPDDIMRTHDLTFEDVRTAVRVAHKIIATAADDLSTIDFDDMLYLPIVLDVPFDPFDYIFVDEYQDTNDIQLEILERLRGAATRYFFVGDVRQAIYGFRGANADSKKKILQRFGCVEMPLSVSFRCSKKVVEEARKYLVNGFPQ